ncbi:hypothetical protein BLNAU_6183 [Blattamonas nauphoetae]|uniref:Uncharacterized protein n=1 Tax=Blattamonas nauphoetae TaxID=2049346 RepID=A0ABQ9Y5D9_9EUKA|nr:hypothetical protein BLNAU_6183 [Blattamonas nauphoetae]
MRCHSSPVSPRQAADLSCRVGMSPERRWEILRFTAGCKSFSTRFSNENDVVHRSVFPVQCCAEGTLNISPHCDDRVQVDPIMCPCSLHLACESIPSQ